MTRRIMTTRDDGASAMSSSLRRAPLNATNSANMTATPAAAKNGKYEDDSRAKRRQDMANQQQQQQQQQHHQQQQIITDMIRGCDDDDYQEDNDTNDSLYNPKCSNSIPLTTCKTSSSSRSRTTSHHLSEGPEAAKMVVPPSVAAASTNHHHPAASAANTVYGIRRLSQPRIHHENDRDDDSSSSSSSTNKGGSRAATENHRHPRPAPPSQPAPAIRTGQKETDKEEDEDDDINGYSTEDESVVSARSLQRRQSIQHKRMSTGHGNSGNSNSNHNHNLGNHSSSGRRRRSMAGYETTTTTTTTTHPYHYANGKPSRDDAPVVLHGPTRSFSAATVSQQQQQQQQQHPAAEYSQPHPSPMPQQSMPPQEDHSRQPQSQSQPQLQPQPAEPVDSGPPPPPQQQQQRRSGRRRFPKETNGSVERGVHRVHTGDGTQLVRVSRHATQAPPTPQPHDESRPVGPAARSLVRQDTNDSMQQLGNLSSCRSARRIESTPENEQQQQQHQQQQQQQQHQQPRHHHHHQQPRSPPRRDESPPHLPVRQYSNASKLPQLQQQRPYHHHHHHHHQEALNQSNWPPESPPPPQHPNCLSNLGGGGGGGRRASTGYYSPTTAAAPPPLGSPVSVANSPQSSGYSGSPGQRMLLPLSMRIMNRRGSTGAACAPRSSHVLPTPAEGRQQQQDNDQDPSNDHHHHHHPEVEEEEEDNENEPRRGVVRTYTANSMDLKQQAEAGGGAGLPRKQQDCYGRSVRRGTRKSNHKKRSCSSSEDEPNDQEQPQLPQEHDYSHTNNRSNSTPMDTSNRAATVLPAVPLHQPRRPANDDDVSSGDHHHHLSCAWKHRRASTGAVPSASVLGPNVAAANDDNDDDNDEGDNEPLIRIPPGLVTPSNLVPSRRASTGHLVAQGNHAGTYYYDKFGPGTPAKLPNQHKANQRMPTRSPSAMSEQDGVSAPQMTTSASRSQTGGGGGGGGGGVSDDDGNVLSDGSSELEELLPMEEDEDEREHPKPRAPAQGYGFRRAQPQRQDRDLGSAPKRANARLAAERMAGRSTCGGESEDESTIHGYSEKGDMEEEEEEEEEEDNNVDEMDESGRSDSESSLNSTQNMPRRNSVAESPTSSTHDLVGASILGTKDRRKSDIIMLSAPDFDDDRNDPDSLLNRSGYLNYATGQTQPKSMDPPTDKHAHPTSGRLTNEALLDHRRPSELLKPTDSWGKATPLAACYDTLTSDALAKKNCTIEAAPEPINKVSMHGNWGDLRIQSSCASSSDDGEEEDEEEEYGGLLYEDSPALHEIDRYKQRPRRRDSLVQTFVNMEEILASSKKADKKAGKGSTPVVPKFTPAVNCSNASDFVVRCFVARLRAGITVIKHNRSRWSRSASRDLILLPDGKNLSWKPAEGEEDKGKRPQLDLTKCLEVRHAWSRDPDTRKQCGTSVLRKKIKDDNSAARSLSLIFHKRTFDMTASTPDSCKVLMEGFSALCFRLHMDNLQNTAESDPVGSNDAASRDDDWASTVYGETTASMTQSVPFSTGNVVPSWGL